VDAAGGVYQYSLRVGLPEGGSALVRVQDCETNIQVKGRDIDAMAQALATVAQMKGWPRVELDGDPAMVAALAEKLRGHGVEVYGQGMRGVNHAIGMSGRNDEQGERPRSRSPGPGM
jgi:hypothetical protein